MGVSRPCDGVLLPGSNGSLPFLRPCPGLATVGRYCIRCAQKRVQNDSIREILDQHPDWAQIIKGDPSRKGKGKPRIALPDWAVEANADVLSSKAEPEKKSEGPASHAPVEVAVEVRRLATQPAGPSTKPSVSRAAKSATLPLPTWTPPVVEPVELIDDDDLFAQADARLEALRKRV